MALEIFTHEDVPQGRDAWRKLRCGLPTASEFSCIMANGAEMKGRASYMRRLAGEIITGDLGETFSSFAMERGKEQEDEARRTYSLISDNAVTRIGFARDLEKGAGVSPDGLVDGDGVVEFKSTRADLLIEIIEVGVFPMKHFWQCQGALWITGRRWCDLVIFCPKMPLFIRRVERDPGKCAELAARVKAFGADLNAMVQRIAPSFHESEIRARATLAKAGART